MTTVITAGLICLGTGTALAAAPSVSGESTSPTAKPSAEAGLDAQVNAGEEAAGIKTECHFQYGTAAVSEHEVACETPLIEGGEQGVAVTVKGLAAGTTYHYLVVLKNVSGKIEGNPEEFTTLPVPATEVPSPIGSTTATFEGKLTPFNAAAPEYFFTYNLGEEIVCTGEHETGHENAGAEAVSTAVTELEPNQKYTVCLVAQNGLGTEEDLTPKYFKTEPAPPEIISESAPAPKATGATLHATINPENQETKYQFEYATEKEAGALKGTIVKVPATAGTIPAAFEEHAVEAPTELLEQQKVYYYRVVAENAKGEKAKPGKIESFLTGPPETPVEAKLKADSTTASSVEVEGTLNPTNAGEPGSTYEFIYNETSSGGCAGGKAAPEPAGQAQGHVKEHVSAKIEGLKPNTGYTFCLIATNAAGEKTSATAEPVGFSTHAAPPVITENSEQAEKETQTTATIVAKVNPEGLDTHVYVEYGKGQRTAPVDIGPLVGEQEVKLPLTGLTANTTYPFHVFAFNDAGKAEGEASFKTLLPLAAPGTKAWWHLRTEPEPTYIHGGVAKNTTQELKVNATGGDVLWLKEVVPPYASVTFAYNASHEEVQSALEGMYGAGNVEVTGGPVGKPAVVTEHEPYVIKFVGVLHSKPVPLPVEADFGAHFKGGSLEGEAHIAELAKGRPDGEILITASNLGDAAANGQVGAGGEPITLSDVLPPGLEAVAVRGVAREGFSGGGETQLNECSLQGENGVKAPACAFNGVIPAYSALTLHVEVDDVGASGHVSAQASVSGGGARPLTVSQPIPLGESNAFGISNYELVNENEGGSPDTQAGSHPFQQTTTIVLNQTAGAPDFSYPNGAIEPAALPKDVRPLWPAGLVGNPNAVPTCPLSEFTTVIEGLNECPADTVVGVARAYFSLNQGVGPAPSAFTRAGLFNLTPSPGKPARFGFLTVNGPVYIDPTVRSGRDYGITVNGDNITQLIGFRGIEVTVWGTPGAEQFNQLRGNACLETSSKSEECAPAVNEHPTAFLTLPTACAVNSKNEPEGLLSSVVGDAWPQPISTAEQPELTTEAFKMAPLDGCNALPFKPEIKDEPDVHAASTPGGLNVDIHIPQSETLQPAGLAQAEPRNMTVALPVGVALNPSSADGLQACTANPGALPQGSLGSPGDQIGFQGTGVVGTEPGVTNDLFTGELPESIAAKGAVEGHETVEGGHRVPESEATLSPGANFCPNGSKIGTATVKTPLLPNPLTGSVYLAAQEQNPFGSVFAQYIVVEDPVSGTLVKLAGEVTVCERAGQQVGGLPCEAPRQIIATFENSPQAPFEDAEVHFFGGERAPLSTPAHCGTYTTRAAFTPWSAEPGEAPVMAESHFEIETGPKSPAYPEGGPCPGNPLPFAPTVTGGAENVNAGAFSPFTATFSRQSGEQNMQSIVAKLPPGLSGILTGVELCPEPAANEGKCGSNSEIGETTVSVGVGGEPYTDTGGKFYLTGPYNGTSGCTVGTAGCAPFGISFEVPATAGPFDLAHTAKNHPACDCVLVRGKIEINPFTSALTITSNPPGTPDSIPTELEGIPLEIQHVNAITTRSNFQFNPTNCSKMQVEGTIESSEGAKDTLGVPFQVTNCAALKFTPKFKVSVGAKTSKANGASLTATVTEPAGALGTQANLTKVKVELPKQLPSRLTTLQKACTLKQFEANPAACPSESKIGYAKVLTPLVPVPLEGPAIFVSHGGEAFPTLTMVLQGYGITIDLVGSTFISKSGVTSTTFKTVPDQPFSSFTLTLPTGKYSALTALGNVCTESLKMPTEFIGQNGMEIHETTSIGVTGCKKLTAAQLRAQKLKAALKQCHKDHNKGKRAKCEKAAYKKYGPVKKAKKSKGKK
jgi:hypothetical protein